VYKGGKEWWGAPKNVPPIGKKRREEEKGVWWAERMGVGGKIKRE